MENIHVIEYFETLGVAYITEIRIIEVRDECQTFKGAYKIDRFH